MLRSDSGDNFVNTISAKAITTKYNLYMQVRTRNSEKAEKKKTANDQVFLENLGNLFVRFRK